MTDNTIQPYIANTAAAIIRRDSNTAWDSAVEKFAKPRPSPQVAARTSQFRKFVDKLTRESKSPLLSNFRLGQTFKIADVQREANAALQAYEERGSSLRSHFLRTLGRDFSNNASAAEALLEFLPEGEYTFIICGALTLVFNAAKKVSKIREQILNCFGSLTRTVEGTKLYQRLYTGNKRLWEAAEGLYMALLVAVQDALAWLDESAWRRTLYSILKQDNYSKPLEEKIKLAVDTRVKEFHEQLEYCQHERIQQIHIGVDGVARSIEELRDEVKASDRRHQEEIQRAQEHVTQVLVSECQGLRRDIDWHFATMQDPTSVRDSLGQLAQGRYLGAMLATVARPPVISAAGLMGLLQVNESITFEDSGRAVQHGQTMSPGRQARAASLLRHPRFHSWFRGARSDILVVDGKDTESQSSTMSALTYIIGKLSHTLLATQTAMSLLCICGLHASPGSPLEGAEGVLRMLIYQLLSYLGDRADLTMLDYNFIESVKAGDIGYLLQLFQSLVLSAGFSLKGPCAVVCLLDGVSFLETSARRPGLERLVATLQQLVLDVNAFGGYLIVKVLLTFPNVSRFARDWFTSESILNLGEEIDHDGHGYDLARLTTISEGVVVQEPLSVGESC